MKTIANLEVVVDDSLLGERGSRFIPGKNGKHTIYINIPLDRKLLKERGAPIPFEETKAEGIASLAHELGHFVSWINNFASHTKIAMKALGALPAEQDAWKVGEMIVPDLDKRFRDHALYTYSDSTVPQQRIESTKKVLAYLFTRGDKNEEE